MHQEITLTIYDAQGATRQVCVESNRFTIGRGADNDLDIDDPGLSRRHAVIETFEGVTQISDCNSRNGTIVNRKLIMGPTMLKNGDAILIGDVCDIRVRITRSITSKPGEPARSKKQDSSAVDENWPAPDSVLPMRAAQESATRLWATPTAIAVAAVALILLVSVALISLLKSNDHLQIITEDKSSTEEATDSALQVPAPLLPLPSIEKDFSIQVEEAAQKVMSQISSDTQRYTFRENAIQEIKRQVERYRASTTLPGTLRMFNQQRAKLVALMQREKVEPGLLVYTVLSEIEIERKGRDPVEVAALVLPDLLWVREIIGSEIPDKSLMVIAAYKMGRGSRLSHPIIVTRRQLGAKSPDYEDTVWYLYEHGGIKKPVYDFVMGLLALGVIAQEPSLFNVKADPLTF